MKEQFDQLEGKLSEYFAAAELLPGVRQEILSERHDEAIAEYVGMVLALDVVGDNPDDQRKFLETYASANWAIGTQGGILDRWKMDDHLAEILRYNAIPPCLDSFYDLYDIIEGDPMYVPPEKRPKLW